MEKQPNRRTLKNYFILKDVQLKLIAINFIHMVLVVLITIAALVVPLYALLMQASSLENQYHAAVLFFAITDQLPFAMALVMLLFIVHQIIMTHQFCGPIINFTHTFREITAGNLTRKVHLRKHDQLLSEAACINSMIDGLSQLIGGIKQEHAGLLLSLQNVCVRPASAEEQQKSEDALREALRQAQNITRCLETFRLADAPAAKT